MNNQNIFEYFKNKIKSEDEIINIIEKDPNIISKFDTVLFIYYNRIKNLLFIILQKIPG